MVDLEDDNEHYTEFKDFREATYVFPHNSPMITYLNLVTYDGWDSSEYNGYWQNTPFFESCYIDLFDTPSPGNAELYLCPSPDPDRVRIILQANVFDFDIQSNRGGGFACIVEDEFDEWQPGDGYDDQGLFFGSVFKDGTASESYLSFYDQWLI